MLRRRCRLVNVVPISCENGLTFKMSGAHRIDGLFNAWVKKNSVIGEELSKTLEYHRTYKTLGTHLRTFYLKIYVYEGEGDTYWLDDELGNLMPDFRHACTLKADLSGLERFLKAQKGSEGRDFWHIAFKVNVLFGGTALKARLTWDEGVSVSHFSSIRC